MKPLHAAAAAAAAAALLLLAVAPAARAAVTVTSRLGFDGGHVPGSVTPVRIEISSSEKEPVSCTLRVLPSRGGVVGGGGGFTTETTVFLAPGARKRLTLPVLAGLFAFDAEWRISIETDRRVLLRHGTNYKEGKSLDDVVGSAAAIQATPFSPTDASRLVVGLLGAPAGGLSWMEDIPDGAPASAVAPNPWRGHRLLGPDGKGTMALPSFVAVDVPTAPDPWICYEGFDALLWIDPDPDQMKDAAQLDAVLEYAARGGILLVAATPGARIPGGSPLAAALPAAVAGHDDASADLVLSGLCRGSPRGTAGRAPVSVARLEGVRGRVLRSLDDGRPLVVRGDYGLGSVVLLAFDPRGLGSSGIEDRASLLLALFGAAAGPGPDEEDYQGAGVQAVVGHLRKRFMTPPPLGLLVLGLAVYVLAIGPVDYFVLKRKKKLRRTVVTFPLIVLSFTLLAWGASFLLFGGEAGKARVAFLDFATAPGRDGDVYRGLDFLGTYSPTGTSLEASWDAPRSFVAFPWLGSGTGYGGQGDSGGLEGLARIAPDGRPSALVDVPLRSHRTVQARFSGTVPAALSTSLHEGEGGTTLSITNGFRIPVHDLQVAWGRSVTSLGDLAPGDHVELPLAAKGQGWSRLKASGFLPQPLGGGGGFFGGEDDFVPRDGTPEAVEASRRAMSRAGAGATFTTLLAREGRTGGRLARALARQGIDLSRQALEGRPVLVCWCDADPLGILPEARDVDSTVVVVRSVAGYAGGEDE